MREKIAIIGCILAVFVVGLFMSFGGESQTVYAESGEDPRTLLRIKAINPGYKIDGVSNVGEMIEISRRDRSNVPISLAGVAIGYTNSSGGYSKIFEFPENSFLAGETILLRLASSPWSELAAANYMKTLAMSGGITLLGDGEIIDRVCWLGEKKTMKIKNEAGEVIDEVNCKHEFESSNQTVLVFNEKTEDFEHVAVDDYEVQYLGENYYLEEDKSLDEEKMASKCKGLEFSEVLTYYESSKSEQFIEFHNSTDQQLTVNGCKVSYKNKQYTLSGVVKADGFLVYYPEGFSLTKNPTNYNELLLIDADGTTIDTMRYFNGQKKGTTWMFFGHDEKGEEIWRTTYAATPGEENNYQEFKSCEEGKVINKATGNCVKVISVTEKVCKEGYYLNILTGRCKKQETVTEKTCKEGYYLNSETNRCRKIQNNDGAVYSLEPEEYEEDSSFVAGVAVLIVVGFVIVYLIYEFRVEIKKAWKKIMKR